MTITYKEGRDIDASAIHDLYDDVGWYAYTKTLDTLLAGIAKSLVVYSAWDQQILVGLIRVVGDGETIIYIQDILVKNAYQRRGIARRLMKHILNQYQNVRQIVLMTDDSEKSNAFYTSMGFKNLKVMNGNCYVIYNQ